MISIKDEDHQLLKDIANCASIETAKGHARRILANIKELMQEQPYPSARLVPMDRNHLTSDGFCIDCNRRPELCFCNDARN